MLEGIEMKRMMHLTQIAETRRPPGRLLRLAERRQKDRDQQRDHANDDEQLNEREGTSSCQAWIARSHDRIDARFEGNVQCPGSTLKCNRRPPGKEELATDTHRWPQMKSNKLEFNLCLSVAIFLLIVA